MIAHQPNRYYLIECGTFILRAAGHTRKHCQHYAELAEKECVIMGPCTPEDYRRYADRKAHEKKRLAAGLSIASVRKAKPLCGPLAGQRAWCVTSQTPRMSCPGFYYFKTKRKAYRAAVGVQRWPMKTYPPNYSGAWMDGYDAYFDGTPETLQQYQHDPEQVDQWLAGYAAADLEKGGEAA